MARLNDELAEGEGAVGWVVQQRRPILGVDVATDRRVANAAELLGEGLRWLTCYPIAIGDRILGAFTVHQAAFRTATPEAESLMGSLAAQAAIALENARLYAETTRRLTETRSLLEVAEVLNSTLDLTLLLKRVAIKVAQVCRVDRCSVELFDGDRVVPAMSQFADGRREPAMWAAFRDMRPYAPGEVPLHARAIETRAPVAVEDVAGSDAVPGAWAAVYGMRACLAVPLLRQDRVIGVMSLDYCDRPRPFADWQRDLAMAVGGQLALALENGRLYTEVQERLRETTTLLGVGRVLSQPGVGEDTMRQLAAEVAEHYRRINRSVSAMPGEIAPFRFARLAVRRAITNLVDNALRYAGEPIEIRIGKENHLAFVDVLDRGPGIPPAEAERLKRPFTRLDAWRSGPGGAGLGLAIVERIAQAHRGRLELLPREGGGLDARLTLATDAHA